MGEVILVTDQEYLSKIEHEHVDVVEHLVSESEQEVRNLKKLSFNQLEQLEDDVWKKIQHIDGHLSFVSNRISEVYYTDKSDGLKLGMIAALREYEDRITSLRNRMTDVVIRAITDRKAFVFRAVTREHNVVCQEEEY